MKHIVIPEYGRIYRENTPGHEHAKPELIVRLQRFDERFAARNDGQTVFDWSRRQYVRANSHVGVVQVPGLTVEILPKIDSRPTDDESGFKKDLAQRNLLYMLSLTCKVPIEERDIASLSVQKMPLLEALIAIFVERLIGELERGVDHAYIRKEENLPYIKGKLLIGRNIVKNAAHKERAFVAYDDFISDTWLNRILKATCRRLLLLSRTANVQKRLSEALALFDTVTDVMLNKPLFDKVHLTRNNERYRLLLNFCRLIFNNQSPNAGTGKHETFSLLFAMERLFEEFIAAFMLKHASDLGLSKSAIHPQARGHSKWLLNEHTSDGARGRFALRPDIIIQDGQATPTMLIDTKWKRLVPEDKYNNVSQADIYQLYAYATRYDCPKNVLLYPKVDGVDHRPFVIPDSKKSVELNMVSFDRDIKKDKRGLIAELRMVLGSVITAMTR